MSGSEWEPVRAAACDNCAFFKMPMVPATLGECRVSAPSRSSPQRGDQRASWPRVLPEDWCGRYKRRGGDDY